MTKSIAKHPCLSLRDSLPAPDNHQRCFEANVRANGTPRRQSHWAAPTRNALRGPIWWLASCSGDGSRVSWRGLASLRLPDGPRIRFQLPRWRVEVGMEGMKEKERWGGREHTQEERERKSASERESNGFCFHLHCKLLHFNATPLGPRRIKWLFLNNRQ